MTFIIKKSTLKRLESVFFRLNATLVGVAITLTG